MPFEKQFDRMEVLDRSAHAFLARGYCGTSIKDLVSATGLNRGSIYCEFTDKRSLFLASLRHYDLKYCQEFLEDLAATHTPREAILAAFDAASKNQDGCLLVCTALEISPHDPEIRDFISSGLQAVGDFFRRMVTRAQEASEVPSHLDPAETGKALLALFLGLRVLARSRAERAMLTTIRGQAEQLLQ